MGVHGLWKLLEPSGKPVPLETLENKVLAVDMSIWLHQLVKGYQDSRGNPLPNAHLLGLFHRICKLLFYKIKPVFVFDGGVPQLKKQTTAARQQRKSKAEREADKLREQLIKNLVKHTALKNVLGDKGSTSNLSTSPQKKEPDMFMLPVRTEIGEENMSSSSEDDSYTQHGWRTADLHAVDVNSDQFKSLPADVRHDILSELKETRKQSSWGKLHEIPKESGDFSDYQMARLLKRRSIQVSLEEAEKEMGGRSLSLGELEEMLTEQGVVAGMDASKRIASDSVTRYLYLKEVTKETISNIKTTIVNEKRVPENEPEAQASIIMQLSSVNSKSERNEQLDVLEFLEKEEEEEESLSSSVSEPLSSLNSNLHMARGFIYENSGLTQKQILALIEQQNASHNTKQKPHGLDRPSTSGVENATLQLPAHCNEESTSVMKTIMTSTNTPSSTLQKISKSYEQMPSAINADITSVSTATENEAYVSNAKKFTEVVNDNIVAPELTLQKANFDNKTFLSANTNLEQKKPQVDASKDNKSLNMKGEENKNEAQELTHNVTKSLFPDSLPKERETNVESFIKKSTINPERCKDNYDTSLLSSPVKGDKNSTVAFLQIQGIESSKDDDDSENNSDGFIEVTDTPKAGVVEVVINPEESYQDDIFADIFSNDTNNINSAEKDISGGKNCHDIESMESLPNRMGEIKTTIEETSQHSEECNSSPLSVKETTSLNEENKKEFETTQEVATSHKSTEELQQLQVALEEEQKQLLAEKGKQDRLATTINQQMQIEAQELLQLFGIPYIVAPMEAEAQCAFLDSASLTEGTITDDSDVWLFGGRSVYKNFFNQKKYVLQFTISEIQHCFKLSRQELVLLALLVGSDYTTGIQGIGPVTALEILAAFSNTEEPFQILNRFQDWWKAGMPVGSGRTSLKSKLQGIQLYEGFPNMAVINAYLHPEVDESKETFSWGLPNLESLREYARQKFGWTALRTDEILIPIMKKLNERQNQMSLDAYFKVVPKIRTAETKLSKRIQKAVQQIGGKADSQEGEVEHLSKKRKQKHASASEEHKAEHSGLGPNSKKARQKQPKKNDCQETGQNTHASTSMEKPVAEENVKAKRSKSAYNSKGECIPQREQDRLNALKNKLKAIEVFRTKHLDHKTRNRKKKPIIMEDANLSESSSDD